MKPAPRTVYLVGAGPGDPGLITVRGLELLRRADVIIHDRLIPHELLHEARADAIIIDAGKAPGDHRLTQDEMNALLIDHARAGRCVVRLKGGDPFVFGRGYEELLACQDVGISCEVVPGVSSALAAPAAAGIPVTHRGVARNFAVVTARTGDTDGATDLDYAALARIDTLIVLMGRGNLRDATSGLLAAGREASTPAACIEQATTPSQRVVTGTLDTIADLADAAALRPPVVTVIGEVARFGQSVAAGALAGRRTEITAEAAAGKNGAVSFSTLSGRVVAVTGTKSINLHLHDLLGHRGATVIDCPLIDIAFETDDAAADILSRLHTYDWLVFTSVHGARGFVRALQEQQVAIEAISNCRIAAVGPATRNELSEHGLRVDFLPTKFCAAELVEQLRSQVAGRRVLLPCGDHARAELAEGLTAAGARVDRLLVYRNVPHHPSPAELERVANEADIVVLSSPTAVRQFVEVGLAARGESSGPPRRAEDASNRTLMRSDSLQTDFRHGLLAARGVTVACLGPTTAAAAARAGLAVSVVAADHRAEGMAEALETYFNRCEVLP